MGGQSGQHMADDPEPKIQEGEADGAEVAVPKRLQKRRPSQVELALNGLIGDIDKFKAEALVHRKDVNDEEKKADEVIQHCDALQALTSSATAVVAAVRWKRKIGKKS